MSDESVLVAEQAPQPLVSVIMNCLNSAKHLRAAIDSVYAQTYSNWEIIFWDNVSTDESPEIAQSYRDGRLRYFRGDATVPLGHARNLAIAKSKGEFVAFLDCDDLWLPQKLEKQVPLFVADDRVGLVYSDTFFFNESGYEKRLYSEKTPYRGSRFPELLNNYLISLETAVVRRSALDSLDHWFDPRFNMVEEHDLFLRIGLDWTLDFAPEALAKWRVHDQSLSWKSPDAFVDETRSMLKKLQASLKIRGKYRPELALAWHGLALAEAKGHWKKGHGRAARVSIRNDPIRDLKGCLMWIASFLPYTMIESVYRVVSKSVTPGKSP